jgi:hypothetical protein
LLIYERAVKRSMTAKTRGRKSLLNAKLEKQICGLLSDGVPIGATCDCVGISTRTYHGWIEKGEADPTSLYAHFMRDHAREGRGARGSRAKDQGIGRLAGAQLVAVALLAARVQRSTRARRSATNRAAARQRHHPRGRANEGSAKAGWRR